MRSSTNLDQIRLSNQPQLQQPNQQLTVNQQQLIDGMTNLSLGGVGPVSQSYFIPAQNAVNSGRAGAGSQPQPNINLAYGTQTMHMQKPNSNQYYNANGFQQHQMSQMHGKEYFQPMIPVGMIAPQQQQQNKSMTSRIGDQQQYNGMINRPHSAFTNHSNAEISLQNDIWGPGANNQSNVNQGINRRLFSSPAPNGQQQQVAQGFQQFAQQTNNAGVSMNFNNEDPSKQQQQLSQPSSETANGDSIFSRPPCEGFGTESLNTHNLQTPIQQNSLQTQIISQQVQDEKYLSNIVQAPSQPDSYHYFGTMQAPQNYLSGINGHHHAQSQQVLPLPPSSTQGSTIKGNQGNEVVFSANVANSGSITQRGAGSFRTGPRQKSNEVMIHNIDKATISFIAQELHQQDVLDISQSLVSRNILIVRFQSCEGAQWAINRYDGQTINQRELRVTIAVDGPHRNRKREVKWESTNLAKITETADVDEDVEQESSFENINIPTNNNSPQIQPVNGHAPQDTNIGQNKNGKQTNGNNLQESQNKPQTQVGQSNYSDQGFIPKNRQQNIGGEIQLQSSVTPPPGLGRLDQQLMQPGGLGFPSGFMMQQNQMQQHAMMQRSFPGNNFEKLMMQQQLHSQRYFQNGSQLMPNSQPLQYGSQQRQMVSQTGFYPEQLPQYKNQVGNPFHPQQVGNGPSQFQPNHYMTQTLNQQDFMINPQVAGSNVFQTQQAHMTIDPSSLQKGQGLDPQAFKEVPGMLGLSGPHSRSSSNLEPLQDLSSHFKDQSFQPSQQQFGFAPLQHMLHMGGPTDMSQFNQMMGIPQNFSSSIETSQQDDIENLSQQNINFPENHGSGSDRESFIFRNNRLSMTTRNVMISNSTRNSDSDSSQKFNKLQFHQTQQFQSPESRKRAMQQIYQETSFEYHRNPASNSGHDTPPFMTPGQNKHLNNSFSVMNGGNSSQGQKQCQFVSEAHQRITHNRNLSLNTQLPSQLLNQDATTQFFMQQHGHHHTQFFISSGGGAAAHHQQLISNLNCASSSSDLNEINNFYPIQQYQGGVAFLPHQTASSQLGPELHKLASAEFDNHSVALPKQKKKSSNANSGGGQGGPQSKNHLSHKSLKYQTYSEQSHHSDYDQAMYELDIEKIKRSEDMRTTVMIKHIPNKYTQRLLLQEINKNHQGKYDFFYLPIDYQHSANVGYAFVNFVHHYMILDFQKEFQGRKWAMFNSKKKCDIKYGRIQGLENLKQHFYASSVMNQNDENYRPRIFEQHNKMDWTAELKKIEDKHKIQNSIFNNQITGINIQSHQSFQNLQQQQSNINSNQSQGSHAQGSHHNRQQSIGGSSSNNPYTNSASQAALSTQKLIEASAEEEEEKEEP